MPVRFSTAGVQISKHWNYAFAMDEKQLRSALLSLSARQQRAEFDTRIEDPVVQITGRVRVRGGWLRTEWVGAIVASQDGSGLRVELRALLTWWNCAPLILLSVFAVVFLHVLAPVFLAILYGLFRVVTALNAQAWMREVEARLETHPFRGCKPDTA